MDCLGFFYKQSWLLWLGLYISPLSKRTADKASVDHAHYSWLLSRDLTNVSFALVLISAGLGLALGVGLLPWIILVAAQALLYIVLSRVAAIRGVRFVTTVLAEASVAAD